MATVTAQDIQDHMDAIFTTAAATMAAKITAEPARYLRDEPGNKLVGDAHVALREAAGEEDFSDLATGDLA